MNDYYLGKFLGYLMFPSIIMIIILLLAKLNLTPWQIIGAAFMFEVIGLDIAP